MKRSSSIYFIEGKKKDEDKIFQVAYSEVEGELCCNFLSKKQALKLMEDELDISRGDGTVYRLVKITTTAEEGAWNKKL